MKKDSGLKCFDYAEIALNERFLTAFQRSSLNLNKSTFLLFLLFFLISGPVTLRAQKICGVSNSAFAAGEELYFKVVYNWGLIWIESAEASFKVRRVSRNGKSCYNFNGSGKTYPRHDWFFKVNDVFETTLDSATFRPLVFKADIHEGSKRDKHMYLFDDARKKAYTIINYGNKPVKVDTLPITACSIDVLTAIYYARNLDYSQCKVNDTLGVSVLIDGKVFPLYVRYLGKCNYTTDLGTFRCIKFRPLLVEGTIFKKGEHMNVWVTDDKNKIPIYVETAIIVGSIKVNLVDFKGLRYPIEAAVK